MKNGRRQLKDIPDRPILEFLQLLKDGRVLSAYVAGGQLQLWHPGSATLHEGFSHSVTHAFDHINRGRDRNLVRAKLKSMLRRGLIDGCLCGCRGDVTITPAGSEILSK